MKDAGSINPASNTLPRGAVTGGQPWHTGGTAMGGLCRGFEARAVSPSLFTRAQRWWLCWACAPCRFARPSMGGTSEKRTKGRKAGKGTWLSLAKLLGASICWSTRTKGHFSPHLFGPAEAPGCKWNQPRQAKGLTTATKHSGEEDYQSPSAPKMGRGEDQKRINCGRASPPSRRAPRCLEIAHQRESFDEK